MSLSDIIYERINDNYSYGKYGNFKVIIMNSNSYINITKLCNYFNENKTSEESEKRFRKWKENVGSDRLINKVNQQIQVRPNSGGPSNESKKESRPNSGGILNESIITIVTGDNELRGTYVHPLLVPHITSWISPDFAIQVSEIVNNHMVKLYREQIREKDDNIKRLESKIDDQTLQIKELLANSKETNDRLSDVEDLLEDTKVDLSIVQDKLEIAVEDRAVKPFDKSKVNQIGILVSTENTNKYYMTCGQKSSVDRVIKRKDKTHKLVDTIDGIPNSIYLFDHVKKQLDSKAKVISRTIQLITIDEPTFLDEIRSLFDGRRNIDLSKRP